MREAEENFYNREDINFSPDYTSEKEPTVTVSVLCFSGAIADAGKLSVGAFNKFDPESKPGFDQK